MKIVPKLFSSCERELSITMEYVGKTMHAQGKKLRKERVRKAQAELQRKVGVWFKDCHWSSHNVCERLDGSLALIDVCKPRSA